MADDSTLVVKTKFSVDDGEPLNLAQAIKKIEEKFKKMDFGINIPLNMGGHGGGTSSTPVGGAGPSRFDPFLSSKIENKFASATGPNISHLDSLLNESRELSRSFSNITKEMTSLLRVLGDATATTKQRNKAEEQLAALQERRAQIAAQNAFVGQQALGDGGAGGAAAAGGRANQANGLLQSLMTAGAITAAVKGTGELFGGFGLGFRGQRVAAARGDIRRTILQEESDLGLGSILTAQGMSTRESMESRSSFQENLARWVPIIAGAAMLVAAPWIGGTALALGGGGALGGAAVSEALGGPAAAGAMGFKSSLQDQLRELGDVQIGLGASEKERARRLRLQGAFGTTDVDATGMYRQLAGLTAGQAGTTTGFNMGMARLQALNFSNESYLSPDADLAPTSFFARQARRMGIRADIQESKFLPILQQITGLGTRFGNQAQTGFEDVFGTLGGQFQGDEQILRALQGAIGIANAGGGYMGTVGLGGAADLVSNAAGALGTAAGANELAMAVRGATNQRLTAQQGLEGVLNIGATLDFVRNRFPDLTGFEQLSRADVLSRMTREQLLEGEMPFGLGEGDRLGLFRQKAQYMAKARPAAKGLPGFMEIFDALEAASRGGGGDFETITAGFSEREKENFYLGLADTLGIKEGDSMLQARASIGELFDNITGKRLHGEGGSAGEPGLAPGEKDILAPEIQLNKLAEIVRGYGNIVAELSIQTAKAATAIESVGKLEQVLTERMGALGELGPWSSNPPGTGKSD